MDTAAWYRWFAENEAAGSSPRYERLAHAVAESEHVLGWMQRLPPAKRQPNLLFASVRFLGGPTDTVGDFFDFVSSNAEDLEATMASRSTQTNEAARCAAFLPILADIDAEIALIEVGASAGLCLFPDRYAYRYGDSHQLGASPVEIRVDTGNTLPAPRRLPTVSWRVGLDLDPLDVSDPADLSWLRACVWPEHEARRKRLDRAAAIVGVEQPRIDRGDLLDTTYALIDEAPRDAVKVVLHSAVLAYVDEADRIRFADTMSQAVRRRKDVIWLSNESPAALPDLVADRMPLAPSSGAHFHLGRNGTQLVAATDPHGRWLRWAQ